MNQLGLAPLCLLSLPDTSTSSRIHPNRCGGAAGGPLGGGVTAYAFGLLKTGDKKPAARKESRAVKDVIYRLGPEFRQDGMKNDREGQKTESVVDILIPVCPQSVKLLCPFFILYYTDVHKCQQRNINMNLCHLLNSYCDFTGKEQVLVGLKSQEKRG